MSRRYTTTSPQLLQKKTASNIDFSTVASLKPPSYGIQMVDDPQAFWQNASTNDKDIFGKKNPLIERRKREIRGFEDTMKKHGKNRQLLQQIAILKKEISFLKKHPKIKTEAEFIRVFHNRVKNNKSFEPMDRKTILSKRKKLGGSPITGREIDYTTEQKYKKEVTKSLSNVNAPSKTKGGEYLSLPITIPEGATTIRLRGDAFTLPDQFMMYDGKQFASFLLEPLFGSTSQTPFHTVFMTSGKIDTGFIPIPENIKKTGAVILRIISNDPDRTEWTYQFEFGGIKVKENGEQGIKIIRMKDVSQHKRKK